MKRTLIYILALMLLMPVAVAQKVEMLPYGDFNSWVTRNIKESRVLGGNEKQCYAIGPNTTVDGDKAYTNAGGSPWASSNVMAKMCGITKVSNAVFPDVRSGGNRCARLTTMMENCKALGIVDIDVLVAGTVFLGRMLEPVKSTSNPYSKMEMGIPYAKRPKALRYDYKLSIPAGNMVYSSGFGKKRTIAGSDRAEVFIYLQRRWEDADGNISRQACWHGPRAARTLHQDVGQRPLPCRSLRRHFRREGLHRFYGPNSREEELLRGKLQR